MVAHYYRNVSAVVFVYDVTRRATFDGLSHWIEECHKHGLTPADLSDKYGSGKKRKKSESGIPIPMLVVGNKCDSGNEDPSVVPTTLAQR